MFLPCRFGPARDPSQISSSLRLIILYLYDKHLASDGKALNYKALKADPAFQTYVNATAELQKADLTALNREERMAFFINIYNAIVVHALAVFGPASNLKQRWDQVTECPAHACPADCNSSGPNFINPHQD